MNAPNHHHGHAHDRGLAGLVRYLRLLPHMWRSPVSDAVVAMVQPLPGERVIDLGSGMGPATLAAARSGAYVVAVDPTPFMRGILRLRRVVSRERRRMTVVDGAAESMPVQAGTIDALWTVNTVHHWSNVESAVLEIRRVLRPGGRVVLVDEDFDDPTHPFHERVKENRKAHGFHFADVDPQGVAAVFKQHGFVNVLGGVEQVAGRPAKVIRATMPRQAVADPPAW
jgi:ubiquinone/menaquinone biosynthesis C-methylase UbiE